MLERGENMQTNRFIEPIIMKKKKHDFKAWRAKRKIIKHCKSCSPSFNEMCEIADFVSLLRETYMYCNNDGFHLFTASYPKNYSKRDCRTMIYSEKVFDFTFLMFLETKEIQIKISRSSHNGGTGDREILTFKDGAYEFKDQYDQERMLFIVSSLMNGVIQLIEYYYKNKRI